MNVRPRCCFCGCQCDDEDSITIVKTDTRETVLPTKILYCCDACWADEILRVK